MVGLLAALVSTAYRICLGAADDVRNALFAWAHGLASVGILIPVLFSSLTTTLAVWLTRRFAPEASGSGTPHVEAVLQRMQGMRWQRILPVKFVGGVLSVNGGLALGREGPTVQMGAALG